MEIIRKISQAIIWIAFMALFASIGFASEIPGLMVPLLALVFIAIVGGILLNLSRNKRHSYDKLSNTIYLHLVGGAVLLIFSLVFPLLSFSNILPNGLIPNGMTFVFTIVLSLLGFLGVYLINVVGNNKRLFAILGFLLIVVVASIPALIIAPIDSSFGTLGGIYFTMLIQAILVWSGFFMFSKKFRAAE